MKATIRILAAVMICSASFSWGAEANLKKVEASSEAISQIKKSVVKKCVATIPYTLRLDDNWLKQNADTTASSMNYRNVTLKFAYATFQTNPDRVYCNYASDLGGAKNPDFIDNLNYKFDCPGVKKTGENTFSCNN